MNDERFLKDWLQDSTDSTPDPNAAADKVVTRLPGARQRRRWLPWPPARRPKHVVSNGRTRFMFSPLQTIAAGALTLAIGGMLLMAAPFGDTTPVSPAAETEALPVTVEPFSASYRWSHSPESGTAVIDESFRGNDGITYLFAPVEASDERFDGALVFSSNDRRYNDGGVSIQIGASRIETDEGAWQERPLPFLNFDRQPGDTVQRVFVGEGGYDGLIAFAVDTWDPDEGASDIQLDGFVIADELPADPIPFYPQE